MQCHTFNHTIYIVNNIIYLFIYLKTWHQLAQMGTILILECKYSGFNKDIATLIGIFERTFL